MAKLVMEKQLKMRLDEAFRRLDDEVREIEEIYEEADKALYDIEKRIAKLRRTDRA